MAASDNINWPEFRFPPVNLWVMPPLTLSNRACFSCLNACEKQRNMRGSFNVAESANRTKY